MATAQSAMQGANAAVVGILGTALCSPFCISAVGDIRDFTLALACFVLLMAWKAPPWVVVLVAAVGGAGLALVERGFKVILATLRQPKRARQLSHRP